MIPQTASAARLCVRLATPDDAAPIARLILAAFREHGWMTPRISALRETPEAILEKMALASGLIVEIDGALVGCVFHEPKSDPRHIYLSRLAVSPEHRGQGIARRLIAEVERNAMAEGFDLVRLATRNVAEKNVALYERLGYRIYDHGSHPGYDGITTVMLEKRDWIRTIRPKHGKS
jgi:ribosomal protein S18 acetylase RimI-like enzyme